MGARGLLVLVTLVGLVPIDAMAQVLGNGRVPGSSHTQFPSPPPAAPAAPPSSSGPGRVSNPPRSSAPPSHPLPGPFAGSVPDPIMRPSTSGDVFRAGRRTYAPRYGRRSARSGGYASGYGAYYDAGSYAYSPAIPETAPLEGRLALFVTPASAQVLVDGFYVGTVADFQDRGLWLESGPRRIELRADGYETVTFDVRINEDQPVEYQRDLAKAAARSEAPRVAAVPKTFYVIPGCYAGDTPPRTDRLPGGCSSRNVRTVPPVLNRLTPR